MEDGTVIYQTDEPSGTVQWSAVEKLENKKVDKAWVNITLQGIFHG